MSNLCSLLKIAFLNSTGLNGLSKSIKEGKEKKKLTFTISLLIFSAAVIIFISTSYSFMLAQFLNEINQMELLIILAVIISSIFIIFTYVYKATGVLFGAKDYTLLMSLPIKSSTILCSKIMEMMFFNYIITFLIVIPASIVYFITVANISWSFFIMMIIGVIFIPMIPVIVSSILAVLISYVSSKFKHKNIVSIITGTLAFLVVMYGSIRMQDIINYFVAHSENLVKGFSKVYPPAKYLTMAMARGDILELIKFIAVSIIPFIVFIILFNKVFSKINMSLGETYKKANYKLGQLKSTGKLKALVNEELRKYFSIPIYVMNTLVGMIIVVGAAIVTLFKGDEVLKIIFESNNLNNISAVLVFLIVTFGIEISCTSVSSISLEGKNLWIKKTLPLNEREIFKGKIICNMIITLPLAIISDVIFFIALKFDLVYLGLNILLAIIFSFLSATLGLVINLYFPKLEWTTPTVVVKQSVAVLINMILTFIIMGVVIGFIVISKGTNILMLLSLTMIIFVILSVIVWQVLINKGVEIFKRI